MSRSKRSSKVDSKCFSLCNRYLYSRMIQAVVLCLQTIVLTLNCFHRFNLISHAFAFNQPQSRLFMLHITSFFSIFLSTVNAVNRFLKLRDERSLLNVCVDAFNVLLLFGAVSDANGRKINGST